MTKLRYSYLMIKLTTANTQADIPIELGKETLTYNALNVALSQKVKVARFSLCSF